MFCTTCDREEQTRHGPLHLRWWLQQCCDRAGTMTKRELLTIDISREMMGGGGKRGPTLHLSSTSRHFFFFFFFFFFSFYVRNVFNISTWMVRSTPIQLNHQYGLPYSISHTLPILNRKCLTLGLWPKNAYFSSIKIERSNGSYSSQFAIEFYTFIIISWNLSYQPPCSHKWIEITV